MVIFCCNICIKKNHSEIQTTLCSMLCRIAGWLNVSKLDHNWLRNIYQNQHGDPNIHTVHTCTTAVWDIQRTSSVKGPNKVGKVKYVYKPCGSQAYPSFCNMKWLRVSPPPRRYILVHHKVYSQHLIQSYPFIHLGEEGRPIRPAHSGRYLLLEVSTSVFFTQNLQCRMN